MIQAIRFYFFLYCMLSVKFVIIKPFGRKAITNLRTPIFCLNERGNRVLYNREWPQQLTSNLMHKKKRTPHIYRHFAKWPHQTLVAREKTLSAIFWRTPKCVSLNVKFSLSLAFSHAMLSTPRSIIFEWNERPEQPSDSVFVNSN